MAVFCNKCGKQLVWGALALAIACLVFLAWYLGVSRPRAQDEAACEAARDAIGKAGWQAYLSEYPEGSCAAQAREGLAAIDKRQDQIACKRARMADSEAGWNAYTRERPEGVCKAEAEKRLAELATAERERFANVEAERKAAEEAAKRKSAEKETNGKAGENEEMKIDWVYSRPAGIRFTKSEITVLQYRACVVAGKCTKPNTGKYCNWGKPGRVKHPINCVDWNQAKSYCEWVGGRLPTEKEWEKEASNGGKRKYAWGDEEISCDYAIWGDGSRTDGCGRDSTWPVCSKPRGNSVSGLCDMSGNVWEWTSSSCKSGSSAGMVRGGSWYFDNPDYLRTSYRLGLDPTYRDNFSGFRCGRVSR